MTGWQVWLGCTTFIQRGFCSNLDDIRVANNHPAGRWEPNRNTRNGAQWLTRTTIFHILYINLGRVKYTINTIYIITYIYILYIYILYVTISYRCTYRMHAWPAKYLRLLSLHMLLFDHGRFGGHWTADHVDCGGRQLMAGGVGKRKDTGRLSTAQLIKSRHQRFWMFLDSSVFCYFDCEGYSLKEYPFWVPPVVRPSGANHMWVTPTRSGGESLECRGLERVATQRGSLYIW